MPPHEITPHLAAPTHRDRQIYAAHVVDGLPLEELAARWQLDVAALPALVGGVESWLASEYANRGAEMRARQTQRLDAIYCEAMAAFQRSRQDVQTKRVVEGESKSGESTGESVRKSAAPKIKLETTTAGQAGEARFLAVARDALCDIRAIWGWEEPQRREPAEPDEAWDASRLSRLSDPQLQALRTAHEIMNTLEPSADEC